MRNHQPIILITRPRQQAERFAQMCRNAHEETLNIIVSSLMRIEILQLKHALDPYCGLIFSSENGVRAFSENLFADNLPAYCVGNRTAKAAHEAGLKAISANGAADDLVKLIKNAGLDGKLLHIRGAQTRGEIAVRLQKTGQRVDEIIGYRQTPLAINQEAKTALAGEKTVILPLFSPATAQLFIDNAVKIKAPLHVIAISDAVAQVISGIEAAKVTIAAAPNAEAVLQAIKET